MARVMQRIYRGVYVLVLPKFFMNMDETPLYLEQTFSSTIDKKGIHTYLRCCA
jgi:hypothetical protein